MPASHIAEIWWTAEIAAYLQPTSTWAEVWLTCLSRNTCVRVCRAFKCLISFFHEKKKAEEFSLPVLAGVLNQYCACLFGASLSFLTPSFHLSVPTIPQFVANSTLSVCTTSQTVSGRGTQPSLSAHLLIAVPVPTGHVEWACLSSRGPQRSPHSGTWPAAGLCSHSVASWWQLSVS